MPQVSVVMSVFNGAECLAETLDSVLNQEGCEFEFIVIDDGSRDGTSVILDEYAKRDRRVRVIRQQNAGLTNALIRGCAEARGEFIARQDAGDISLPGRLRVQLDFMRNHVDAVMCCSAALFMGPLRELLYKVDMPMEQLDIGLRRLKVGQIQGPPHHGATLFRTSAYRRVGGYRLPFVVAQDIDLWLRMVEIGRCLGITETLYEARQELGSISSSRRKEQLRFCALAVDCAAARGKGGNEQMLLQRIGQISASSRTPGRYEKARFNYFIASCLRKKGDTTAKRYYWQAICENPLHIKALLRVVFG